MIVAFGNDLKIRVVSKDDVAVAAIVTLFHKKSVVYKYGVANTAFNNMGGTPLLLWKTIEDAKEAGLEELDLGRSDTDNPGLINFKDHWGAVGTSLSYWSYPRRTGGAPAGSKKIARRLVSAMPNLALEAAGKLLYKHFG